VPKAPLRLQRGRSRSSEGPGSVRSFLTSENAPCPEGPLAKAVRRLDEPAHGDADALAEADAEADADTDAEADAEAEADAVGVVEADAGFGRIRLAP
jgi:hypothetical protein